MTTPSQEQVEAEREGAMMIVLDPVHDGNAPALSFANAIATFVASRVAEAKREAWEEGARAVFEKFGEEFDIESPRFKDNPYSKEQKHGG